MGSGCEPNPSPPDFSNLCSDDDYIGQIYAIPNFCSEDPAGDNDCSRLSSEWSYSGTSECCEGGTVQCRRNKFDGNQQQCCLKNYDGTRLRSNCFSDQDQKQTCDPNYRGPIRTGCRNLFRQVCVDVPPEKYASAWSGNFCQPMLEGNIRNTNGSINQEGMEWAQSQMEVVFSRALPQGVLPVGQADPFQRILLDVCLDNPQACQPALLDLCSKYDRSSASGNSEIANFCGCHMIPSVYAIYTDQYGIPSQCDPICARSSTIQSVNSTGIVQKCNSSVCIIDNVTINLNSSSAGNIELTQICGGCTGAATCRCTIADLSLETVESELGNIELEQYCQGSLTCYRENPEDPTGPAIEVSCSLPDGEPPEVPEVIEENSTIRIVVIVFLIIFGGIVLVLGIALLIVATRPTPKPTLEYVSEPSNNVEGSKS